MYCFPATWLSEQLMGNALLLAPLSEPVNGISLGCGRTAIPMFAENQQSPYLVMGHSYVLKLNGRYPFSARLDDIFQSVCDAHEAQGIDAGHIPSAEPALLIHSLVRSLNASNTRYNPTRGLSVSASPEDLVRLVTVASVIYGL